MGWSWLKKQVLLKVSNFPFSDLFEPSQFSVYPHFPFFFSLLRPSNARKVETPLKGLIAKGYFKENVWVCNRICNMRSCFHCKTEDFRFLLTILFEIKPLPAIN